MFSESFGVLISQVDSNGVIGVEDILLNRKNREQSVKIASLNATVLFMTLKNFNEKLLKPFHSLKHRLSKNLESTLDFHDY